MRSARRSFFRGSDVDADMLAIRVNGESVFTPSEDF